MLERLELEKFTAFHTLTLDFVPGVNVFVGTNGTGKTHLLKVLYAITEAHRLNDDIAMKLRRVFMPQQMRLGRLVWRSQGGQSAFVRAKKDGKTLSFRFSSNQSDDRFSEFTSEWAEPTEQQGKPVFIPPKDMLAHAPGFRSLYDQKEIHFDETYRDILVRAFAPVSKGAPTNERQQLEAKLEGVISGQVSIENENFYLKNDQGNLEFSLLAEGLRKFALILQLIKNGTLAQSTLLFWDEPEANINPSAIKDLVDLLLHLSREMRVQIFIATHSDFVLQELDLQQRQGESRFFGLYRSNDRIAVEVADRAESLAHNAIDQENMRLYDQEIARVLRKAP